MHQKRQEKRPEEACCVHTSMPDRLSSIAAVRSGRCGRIWGAPPSWTILAMVVNASACTSVTELVVPAPNRALSAAVQLVCRCAGHGP